MRAELVDHVLAREPWLEAAGHGHHPGVEFGLGVCPRGDWQLEGLEVDLGLLRYGARVDFDALGERLVPVTRA